MKNLFFLLLHCTFSASFFAQAPTSVWTPGNYKSFNGSTGTLTNDQIRSAIPVSDGGFLLAGVQIQPNGNGNIWLLKLNAAGAKVVERVYNQPNNVSAMSFIETIVETDDGYVVVCQVNEGNTPKNRRFKVDKEELNLLEDTDQRTVGVGSSSVAMLSNGLILMGSPGKGGGNNTAQLEVLNPQDLTTVTLLDNASKQTPEVWGRNIQRILPTPDGGCYLLGEDNVITGETGCTGTKGNIWVCRLNADLKPVWSRTYGGVTTDLFLDGELREGGNVVILGKTPCASGVTGPRGIGAGGWVMELNQLGDILTVRSLRAFDSGTGNNQVLGLALLPGCPDALLLTGVETVSNNRIQGYVTKVRLDERPDVPRTGTGFWTINFVPSAGDPAFRAENVAVLPATGRIFVWGTVTKSAITGNHGDFFAGLFQPDASPCTPKAGAGITPLACNQILTNENTAAAGTPGVLSVGTYLGAPNIAVNARYDGPEKTYRINVPNAANLRLTLDIAAANNVDLDIFLFKAGANGEAIGAPVASSAANNTTAATDFKQEIVEYIAEPGNYIAVVDGRNSSQRGVYSLALDCGCAACPCVEPSTDSPGGLKLLSDDFEAYQRTPSGNPDPQSTRWNLETSTLPNVPQIAKIGNESQTLQITGARKPIAWDISALTPGRYRLSFQLFVVAGKTAGYELFRESVESGTFYEMTANFNINGLGDFTANNNSGGGSQTLFNYTAGKWLNIVHLLDLGQDSVELWIDGNFCGKRAFNNTKGNDPNDATDDSQVEVYTPQLVFFGSATADYRVDNLCLWKQTACNPAPLTQDCFSSPGSTFYASETDARCALYTNRELQPCRSVCETPATVFHREPQFTGTVGPSGPPNLALLSDCVRDEYLDRGNPFPRFADLVLFYNESSKNAGVTFTQQGSGNARAFVFQCICADDIAGVFQISDDVITLNGCEQLCLGRINGDYSNDSPRPRGYYYILILSDRPDSYSLNIIPEGPCGLPVSNMSCGAPVNGSLTNETNTFKKGDHAYQVYNGPRSYAGRDKIYTFTLSRPQYVDLSLQSATPLGMFLYTDRCGENPILYRELPQGGGITLLDSFYLPAAQYYICVDEAEPNQGGNFVLRLDQCTDAPLSQVLAQLGIVEDANCPKNTQQTHQIGLATPDQFAEPVAIAINDVVHFKFLDHNNKERVADYRLWNGTSATFNLPADQSGDPLFCGYKTGEPLRLAIQHYDNASSEYADYTMNTTGLQTFQPGSTTSITGMERKSSLFFDVNPQILNPSNAGGKYLVRVASSGFSWRIAPTPGMPPAPWVKIPIADGSNNQDRTIEFEPNPGTAARTALLDVFNTNGSNAVKTQIRIVQSGDCSVKPGGVIVPGLSSVCPGDLLTLSLALPSGAQAPELYEYKWNTGQSSQDISTTVPDLTATKITYTVSVYDRVCGTVGTVTEILNLQAGTWKTSFTDPQIHQSGDQAGAAVAFSDDWAAVGVPQFDDGSTRVNAGRVLLYERVQSGGNPQWLLRKTLLASNNAANRQFGMRLSFHGNFLIVGAPGSTAPAQSGSACLFEKNRGGINQWGEVKRFDPPAALVNGSFGSSVGLSGNYLMIGAERSSQTLVYHRNQGGAENWGQVKTLTAAANSNFGGSLAIEKDIAVIGAKALNTTPAGASGTAIVFQHRPTVTDPHNWVSVDSLVPTASADLLKAGDQLGHAVAMSGPYILAGAPKHDNGNANTNIDNGAAWIFERDPAAAAQWKRVRKLIGSASAGTNYGNAVALAGEYALVGAEAETTPVRGAAYAYHRRQGLNSWGLVEKIVPATTVVNPTFGFGSSVAVSESHFLVGAAQYDTAFANTQIPNRGRAYFFHAACVSGIPPEMNTVRVAIQEEFVPTLQLECRPIPFSDQLTVSVEATEVAQAHLVVFDIAGSVVETLYQGDLDGFYTFAWNAASALPGVYYVMVQTPTGKTIKPVVKIKP